MTIAISDYLQGRNHNSHLLGRIADEFGFDEDILEFNQNNDRAIIVEWSMSAKYQEITFNITMLDGGEMSDEAKGYIVHGTFGELVDNAFGAYVDEDNVKSTWASISLGF